MYTVSINNKEFPVFFNLKAMKDVEDICGGLENLGDYLKDKSSYEAIEVYAKLLTSLINGAIYKHNAEITLGIEQGEKKNFVSVGDIGSLIQISDFSRYQDEIYTCINGDMKVEVETTEEIDPDLAYVESEKNV